RKINDMPNKKENKLVLYKDDEGKLSVNTLFADEDASARSSSRLESSPNSSSPIRTAKGANIPLKRRSASRKRTEPTLLRINPDARKKRARTGKATNSRAFFAV
ncbi:MAG: hypothetical protein II622_00970, partial [Thermoguttaceae bacterium]|nr:hypothetical protein [Thermoguttaceae bacterium]